VQDREAEKWKSERKGGRVGKTGLQMFLYPVEGRGYVTAYWGTIPKKAKLTQKGDSQVLIYVVHIIL
jgi:hypothetical protein